MYVKKTTELGDPHEFNKACDAQKLLHFWEGRPLEEGHKGRPW